MRMHFSLLYSTFQNNKYNCKSHTYALNPTPKRVLTNYDIHNYMYIRILYTPSFIIILFSIAKSFPLCTYSRFCVLLRAYIIYTYMLKLPNRTYFLTNIINKLGEKNKSQTNSISKRYF